MNFELLLVLLMRENGKVTLSQADLDAADDERHNICFALSLDNKALEVFVVSRQSGIIRSPEATAWAQPNPHQQAILAPQPGANQPLSLATQYSPPPLPPVDEAEQRRQEALNIVESWRQQGLSPAASGDGAQPQPEPQSPQPNRIVEMPAKQGPEKVFPFQVGSSPQDAKEVSLSDIQNRLLKKDHEIAQEEAAAAARVESQA
jgi:hypothetical protein